MHSFSPHCLSLLLAFSPFCLLAQVNLESGKAFEVLFSGDANDTEVSFLTGDVQGAVLTEDRFGTPNSAYAFDGVSAYIKYPHSEVFNFGPSDSFTISIWIRQAVNQNSITLNTADILSKWLTETGTFATGEPYSRGYPFALRAYNQSTADHGAIQLLRYDGNVSFGGCETISDISSLSSTSGPRYFNDNIWHHLVFRKQSSNGFLNLWVDGVDYGLQDDDSGDGGSCTTKNISPLFLGMRYMGNSHFTGALDDLQIWSRTLTDDELAELFSVSTSIGAASVQALSVGYSMDGQWIHLSDADLQHVQVSVFDLAGRQLDAEMEPLSNGHVRIRCVHQGLAVLRVDHAEQTYTRLIRY